MKTKILIVLFASMFAFSCGGDTTVTFTDARPIVDSGPNIQSPCNLVDPNGANACVNPNEKCTLIDDGSASGTLVSACVPITGTAAANQPCAREANDSTGWGHDDCEAGQWCSGVGVITPPGGTRICRSYCTNNFDCSNDNSSACLALYPSGDAANQATGFCMPKCDFFAGTCAAQDTRLACHTIFNDLDNVLFSACWPIGTVMPGGDCDAVGGMSTNCQSDYTCIDPTQSGQTTCIQLCDTDMPPHLCTTGTCAPQTGLNLGGGICMP